MSIASVDGSFEGNISFDGNTITGTWTQGNPLPLILTRATPETEWAIPEPPPPPRTMPADAKPKFDVTTMKPSQKSAGIWFPREWKRMADHSQYVSQRPDQDRLRPSSQANHRRPLLD